MTKGKTTSIALALAAASLFGTVAPAAAGTSGSHEVKCYGVNGCKGHSSCKTANSDCKGMNSCKGQGFVNVQSKHTCDQLGGTVK